MTRALVVLDTVENRRKVCRWAMGVAPGSRVEFKAPKRTLPQNDKLWALLTEIQAQMKARSVDFTTDQWKVIFLHAFGREIQFLPAWGDEKTFVPYGQSSSDLGKEEMSAFIEFIIAEATQKGLTVNQHSDTGTDAASEPVGASPDASEGAEAPPPASAPSTIHFEWLQNISRMLVAATHYGGEMELLKNQKRAALASYERPADCPEIIRGKAEAVFGYCRQIVLKELEFTDGLAVIAGVCGCEPDDLQRSVK